MKRKPKKYSFINKKNSVYGRISTFVGILALFVFIAAIVISYMHRGDGGILVGILGVMSFIISIIGFIFGLIGFQEADRQQLYCWIGSIANAVIWLGMLGMVLAFI